MRLVLDLQLSIRISKLLNLGQLCQGSLLNFAFVLLIGIEVLSRERGHKVVIVTLSGHLDKLPVFALAHLQVQIVDRHQNLTMFTGGRHLGTRGLLVR